MHCWITINKILMQPVYHLVIETKLIQYIYVSHISINHIGILYFVATMWFKSGNSNVDRHLYVYMSDYQIPVVKLRYTLIREAAALF